MDKECPKFANVAQMALNASNHIASQIGELEAAQMISDHIDNEERAERLTVVWHDARSQAQPMGSNAWGSQV